MSKRVVITGLGTVTGLGVGIDALWGGLLEQRRAVSPIRAFDAGGFACSLGCELPEDFKVSQFVPKTYRKATKVMARDTEIAVASADLAARDAGLFTRGNAGEGQAVTYAPERVGAHIGAGLIAAELNELTSALVNAKGDDGKFDYHKWGREGMGHLTPLWLLKYLPNMLACHVTIVHDAQGPSNTITCNEPSGLLSIGESLRVIQRGQADMCFCGGADSKMNPMGFLREVYSGRLTTTMNDNPSQAVRPFDAQASGAVPGEGGGIVTLESEETAKARNASVYACVLGFGASQTVNPGKRNLFPDEHGRGMVSAMSAALREATISHDAIDLIVAFGCGHPDYDKAEHAALCSIFSDRLAAIPVVAVRPFIGNCGAGGSAIDLCVAAKAIKEQTFPPSINRDHPLPGMLGNAPARQSDIRHVLVCTTGLGGQNAALVLGRA